MKIEKFTVKAGISKSFRVFHMSDNHLCLADGRDDERKTALAQRRDERIHI